MVVPTLHCGGDPEPFVGGTKIRIDSGIADVTLQPRTIFDWQEILNEKYTYLGTRQINSLLDAHGVNTNVVCG